MNPDSFPSLFPTGAFCLSVDFSLAWGEHDQNDDTLDLEQRAILTRERFIPDFLTLLHKHHVRATWNVVGHLLLDRCDGNHQPAPRYARYPDWYRQDPILEEKKAPAWYGLEMIEQILAADPKQEFGCMGFSHEIFNEPGMNAETALASLARCKQAAEKLGIRFQSFCFPRGAVGHRDAIIRAGFRGYRGPLADRNFSLPPKLQNPLRSAYLALRPCACPVWPHLDHHGLVVVPTSWDMLPFHGAGLLVPLFQRVNPVRLSLFLAAAKEGLVHVTVNPMRFCDSPRHVARALSGLDAMLGFVAAARDRAKFEILTMGDIIGRVLEEGTCPLPRQSADGLED